MGFANVDPSIVEGWLSGVADFVAADRSARLIYTHPLGATKYIGALRQFLSHTDQLARENQFRWYTMTQLADFLNTRKKVTWSLVNADGSSLVLKASNPQGLNRETWILAKSQYDQPKLFRGKAQVSGDSEHWLITAGDCKDLAVQVTRKKEL